MKVSFANEPSTIDVESSPVIESTVTVGGVTEVVDSTPVDSIPMSPASSALVPAAPRAVEKSDGPGLYDDENIDFSDIILPRLNIVHGVGELSTIFNPGEIVLNQSLVVHVPKNDLKKIAGHPPLSITVIGFRRRQYVEKTVGGAQGNLFSTAEEVVKAGGVMDYKEAQSTGKPLYQTLATALLLLEKPAHIPDEDRLIFAHESEGRWYSLALWSMKGTAFTHAAKSVFTARKLGHLKAGYPSYSWSLTTTVQKFGENPTQIPVLRPGTKNTPEFAAFVKEVLNSGN